MSDRQELGQVDSASAPLYIMGILNVVLFAPLLPACHLDWRGMACYVRLEDGLEADRLIVKLSD